jgi:hypothetical protein
MPWQVVYLDVRGNLARTEFSDSTAACTYAQEHAQSSVINGDPYLDHYVGPRIPSPSDTPPVTAQALTKNSNSGRWEVENAED